MQPVVNGTNASFILQDEGDLKIIFVLVCGVGAGVRLGRCMGLFGLFLLVIGLWAWNWAILNIEDRSDVRRGTSSSHEDRLESKQVWAGTRENDWLVDSIYQRILDPRIPSDFTFTRHPAPERSQDGEQGEQERSNEKWWKRVAAWVRDGEW